MFRSIAVFLLFHKQAVRRPRSRLTDLTIDSSAQTINRLESMTKMILNQSFASLIPLNCASAVVFEDSQLFFLSFFFSIGVPTGSE